MSRLQIADAMKTDWSQPATAKSIRGKGAKARNDEYSEEDYDNKARSSECAPFGLCLKSH